MYRTTGRPPSELSVRNGGVTFTEELPKSEAAGPEGKPIISNFAGTAADTKSIAPALEEIIKGPGLEL